MTDSVINLIHEVELNIFKQFRQLTSTLNINYIALGGTLLGAIRHQALFHGMMTWTLAFPERTTNGYLTLPQIF